MLYKGSCHCGQVAFEVEGDLDVRCLEGVEFASLPLQHFDGRSI